MFDGSTLPLEENLRRSSELLELAAAARVVLEVEAGVVGRPQPAAQLRRHAANGCPPLMSSLDTEMLAPLLLAVPPEASAGPPAQGRRGKRGVP